MVHALVYILDAITGHINCNSGLVAVTASYITIVSTLVVMIGSIDCYSGLAANDRPHWLSITYYLIFGFEIKYVLHYAELMWLM